MEAGREIGAPRRSAERADALERRFDVPMLLVALLVIPTMLLEAADAGEPWDTFAAVLNWGIWIAFVVEMVAMLRVVPDRRAYLIAHPLEVLVILLTPPFLTSVFSSLGALRVLRAARLLRLEPLVRWVFSSGGVRYAALLAVLVVLTGGAAFADMEDTDYWEGIYWAVSTMTTVGYGDFSPTTMQSQALAIAVMLVGIGFVAVLTGAFAERFLHDEVGALAQDDADDRDRDAVMLDELRALAAEVAMLRRAIEGGPPNLPNTPS